MATYLNGSCTECGHADGTHVEDCEARPREYQYLHKIVFTADRLLTPQEIVALGWEMTVIEVADLWKETPDGVNFCYSTDFAEVPRPKEALND